MAPGDPIPFRVGMAARANSFLAIWMADDAGFYRAHGLELHIVPMVGGRDAGAAFSAGRIDLMHIGMSSVVRANRSGAGLVTIGSLSNVIRGALFTAPGLGAADLKGGTIGISSTGSESDAVARMALQRLGLAGDDVSWKEIGAERLDAIRDGTVTAAMLDEPHRSEALRAGLNPIADLLSERVPWLYSGLVVKRAYLEDHRDVVMRFLKATIEGNYLALFDRARASKLLAGALALNDPASIELAYGNFASLTPANAEIDRAGAENIISIVAAGGGDVDEYADTSVLDQLRGEGYFDAMRSSYGQG